ncbi:MAG: DUF1540 domain-containing protein [Armatimonadetes bacterium]|nr:DUF1540 domain-containing protein [Armatimonadota bacterium]
MVPEVKKCHVEQCFYNKDMECNAHSILVGSSEPVCETFMQSSRHTNKSGQAEVGACRVDQCEYNKGMFCHACSDIEVGFKNNQAWCTTFEPKS